MVDRKQVMWYSIAIIVVIAVIALLVEVCIIANENAGKFNREMNAKYPYTSHYLNWCGDDKPSRYRVLENCTITYCDVPNGYYWMKTTSHGALVLCFGYYSSTNERINDFTIVYVNRITNEVFKDTFREIGDRYKVFQTDNNESMWLQICKYVRTEEDGFDELGGYYYHIFVPSEKIASYGEM
jgi:hypothetical protein